MEMPEAPIIVLRQGDDAVHAFVTTEEAEGHLKEGEHLEGTDLAGVEFFDARGRRLDAVVGPDGGLADLRVESNDSHAEHVRERVRRRSQEARQRLDEERDNFESVDESPLTLADEEICFEDFVSELAEVLSRGTKEPVPKDGHPDHTAGWWHNTFGH